MCPITSIDRGSINSLMKGSALLILAAAVSVSGFTFTQPHSRRPSSLYSAVAEGEDFGVSELSHPRRRAFCVEI